MFPIEFFTFARSTNTKLRGYIGWIFSTRTDLELAENRRHNKTTNIRIRNMSPKFPSYVFQTKYRYCKLKSFKQTRYVIFCCRYGTVSKNWISSDFNYLKREFILGGYYIFELPDSQYRRNFVKESESRYLEGWLGPTKRTKLNISNRFIRICFNDRLFTIVFVDTVLTVSKQSW